MAVGTSALYTQSFSYSDTENVAVGFEALKNNQPTTRFNGSSNTALGTQALVSNETGLNNTACGYQALVSNQTGASNTACGRHALYTNSFGNYNTAIGVGALYTNDQGTNNTAIGYLADVSTGNLTNATAIGYFAKVNANNKVRIGNSSVTVIEGAVDFTFPSDRTKKENFRPVDGAEVLRKIRAFNLTSWNYIGHDPTQFRHYGPMAQDFYAAFGHDAVGAIGTVTTINSSDMAGILMSAVQALGEENAALKKQLAEREARDRERDARERERDARLARLERMIPAGRPTAQKASLKTASLNSK